MKGVALAKKIAITGIIGWDTTARGVREELQAANGEAVEFDVSSPGGFISQGLEIFNLIRNYGGETTAVLSGFAMSMASYIPLACDKVKAHDNAVYMIHNARGGVWGDHNDILAYGQFTKGLSGLLAKQYAKRTGKSVDELAEMMDKETFFFGDEMLTHGFVDEIIETEDDGDQEACLAAAQAIYHEAYAKWSADPAEARKDFAQAMAIMPSIQPPAAVAAGKPKKEEVQMALKELLDANPAAKAEYDQALNAARTEGKQELQAVINSVAPIMASTEYPPIIGQTALKVLKGEASQVELTSSVAAVDAVKQMNAQTAAQTATEQQGATPAQQQAQYDPAQPVASEDDLQAAIALAKGGN